jgi:ABC-2 type transport system permease protein
MTAPKTRPEASPLSASSPEPLGRPHGVSVSFARLTKVELRKMVDTRAGFWLQLTTAFLTLAAVVLFCVFADTEDQNLRDLFSLATAPAGVLLPVIGILLVSSEWSQRTALITFTLVPRRMRVLGAKLSAAAVLAAVVLVLAFVVALVAAAAIGAEGSLTLVVALQICLVTVTGLLTGVAFGAALLNSAPAIVLYFALPIVWGLLGSLSFLEGAAHWLDTARTTAPMMERSLSGEEWAQFGTSILLWLGVPLAIGVYRIAKGEIRAS